MPSDEMCFSLFIISSISPKKIRKCTLLGCIPSTVGYQPTLAIDFGDLQERIMMTYNGSIISVQAIYVHADDFTDPASTTNFPILMPQLCSHVSDEAEAPEERRKRFERHQIEVLETVFIACPHPDEKKRINLSRRLGLKPQQIKFWFQNKNRTHIKVFEEIAMDELTVLVQTNGQLWIKAMYDDKGILDLGNYRKIFRTIDHQYLGVIQHFVHRGMAFCDQRLLATLQRMVEHQNVDIGGVITIQESKRSMMTLSHSMVKSFCSNLCPGNEIQIRVLPHEIVDNVEPNGIILNAITSTWLPFSTERNFSFFKDESKRNLSDMLSIGNIVQPITDIYTGLNVGYSASHLSAVTSDQNSTVNLGPSNSSNPTILGSIVALSFQIRMNSKTTTNLNPDLLASINRLMSDAVQNMKTALNFS